MAFWNSEACQVFPPHCRIVPSKSDVRSDDMERIILGHITLNARHSIVFQVHQSFRETSRHFLST
jgi:hypothetical protein